MKRTCAGPERTTRVRCLRATEEEVLPLVARRTGTGPDRRRTQQSLFLREKDFFLILSPAVVLVVGPDLFLTLLFRQQDADPLQWHLVPLVVRLGAVLPERGLRATSVWTWRKNRSFFSPSQKQHGGVFLRH